MKDLLQASRVLLADWPRPCSSWSSMLLTNNLILAVGLGMALGVGQIGWQLAQQEAVEALQWLSMASSWSRARHHSSPAIRSS